MDLIHKALILIITFLVISISSSDIQGIEVKIDYYKTKEAAQYCLNEVLNLLQADVHQSRKPKLRLLVVLQNNLNNIVHYKWKVHSQLKNIARTEFYSIPLKLYEYIETAITDIDRESKVNNTEIRNNTVNNQDTGDLYSEILNAINSQDLTDSVFNNILSVDNKSPKNISRRNIKISISKEDDDLEVWEPDEEDLEIFRRANEGKPVGIIQYPFVASIHIKGRYTGTGCIIHKDFVITAASSVQRTKSYKGDRSPVDIRIGSQYMTSGGKVLPAQAVTLHPRYDPHSLDFNLAMIKVKNMVLWKNPAVKKIRVGSFPEYLPRDYASAGVYILGWRSFPEMSSKRSQLSWAYLDMTSLDECMQFYSQYLDGDRNFCAGLIYKGTGACNGDIGSPAIVSGNLVGLVNFGPPHCGSVSSPSVFTKLAVYSNWINDLVKKEKNKIRFKSKPNKVHAEEMYDYATSPKAAEEMLILRQLVHEIDKPNNKISQIIEEDPEIEDEMKIIFQTPSTVVDAAHHSLVNKSLVLIPGVNIPSYVTESPSTVTVTAYATQPVVDIGLPDHLPYDIINEYAHNSEELRFYLHDLTHQGDVVPDNMIQIYAGNVGLRTEPKLSDVDTESNDNFEYESSDGLSIEIEKPKHGKVLDLGEYNVNVDLRSEPKSSKTSSDVWSEVVRLNRLKLKGRKAPKSRMESILTENQPKRFRSIGVPENRFLDLLS